MSHAVKRILITPKGREIDCSTIVSHNKTQQERLEEFKRHICLCFNIVENKQTKLDMLKEALDISDVNIDFNKDILQQLETAGIKFNCEIKKELNNE